MSEPTQHRAVVALIALLTAIQAADAADGELLVDFGTGRVLHDAAAGRLRFQRYVDVDVWQTTEVDAKEQRVIRSPDGTYFALCSRFITETGRARVYHRNGKQVGRFPLADWWKVQGVSDVGPIVALGKELPGESPLLVRLCDVKGEVLADHKPDPTRVLFTPSGRAIVWGPDASRKHVLVRRLNKKGRQEAQLELDATKLCVFDVAAMSWAREVALLVGPRTESFADRATLWWPGEKRYKAVPVPKDHGEIQPNPSFSPGGAYLAVRIGGLAVAVIRTADATLVLHRKLAAKLPRRGRIRHVLDVTPLQGGDLLARCRIADNKGERTERLWFDERGRWRGELDPNKTGWKTVPVLRDPFREQRHVQIGLRCRDAMRRFHKTKGARRSAVVQALVADLDRLAAEYPDVTAGVRARFQKADVFMFLRRYADSVAELEEIVRRYPQYPQSVKARVLWAERLGPLRQHDLAVQVLEPVRDAGRKPKVPALAELRYEVRMRLAEAYVRAGRRGDADQLIAETIKQFPRKADTTRKLYESYTREGP
jgi:hypothetical protein